MNWKFFFGAALAAVIWLAKASVAAAVLLGVLVAGSYLELERLSPRTANVWLMVLGLLAIGTLFYAVLRLLVRMLLSPRFWGLFGTDPVARLIALGIVTYFAPRAMYSLVTAPLNAALQLLGELAKIVRQLSDREYPSDMGFDITIAWAAWMLESAAGDAYRALNRLFDNLPVTDVIVALAAWVLIGHLLSGATDATRQGQLRLFALLRNLSQPQRRIASLAVVFLVGIYFSTAAIVAIPWLHGDTGSQTFNRGALEKALEPLTPKADDKNPLLTPVSNSAADQFRIIATTIEDTRKRAEAERAPSLKQVPAAGLPQLFTELARVASEAKQDRDRAAELRAQLRDDYLERRSRIVSEALAVFDAETVVPMNSQERAFFFHDIQRSANEQVQEMERVLRECNRRLTDIDKQLELAATDLAGMFKGSDGMTMQAYGQANNRLTSVRGTTSAAIRGCEAFPRGRLYVTARDPGAGWGPFAVVSQWLLRTRSQELALITGMFGFGLLGSAITTFVRPQRRRDVGVESLLGSVMGEVASIVARGLSAAIVVFLAVKGGLAIFSGRETEPNAYVLFFTCLVGAVFSEKVWDWARRKLDEGLPLKPAAAKAGTPAGKKP